MKDTLSKRERVELTLSHRAVDRVALHDHLAYHPGVVSMWSGRRIEGHGQTLEDIGKAVAATLDSCFPFHAPCGTARHTDAYGFVYQNDNWTTWRVSRPFTDERGAMEWLRAFTKDIQKQTRAFNPDAHRASHRERMKTYGRLTNGTVVMDIHTTGFCEAYDRMGLELFSYFQHDYPGVFAEYMEASATLALLRAQASADIGLTPVVLIAEDFATKQGPIFSGEFLDAFHFPHVKRLARVFKEQGIRVIYHSDGNYKKAIPGLMACGVDGFYCLEPNCGMDIVELKTAWPEMVWAGGVDGVDLLERGSPEDVRREVLRHVIETNAVQTGGMLVGSSSEINPPVKPENFRAMVEAARGG